MNQGQSLEEYIQQNRGNNSGNIVKRGSMNRHIRGPRQMAIRPQFKNEENRSINNYNRFYNQNYKMVTKKYENDRNSSFRHPSNLRSFKTKIYNNEQAKRKFSGRSQYHMQKQGIVPTLQVAGFAGDIQNHQLNELFSTVGNLVKCKIDYDKLGNSRGVAFIKYEQFQDSQRAFNKFHQAELDGRRLFITRKYSNKVNQFVNKPQVLGVKRRNYFKTKRYEMKSQNWSRNNRR